MTKQVVRFGTAVMTTLLALVALWQFHQVVIYVLISLALAAAVRPVVQRWVRRGFIMRLVLIFLFLVALGCILALSKLLRDPPSSGPRPMGVEA